MVQENLQHDPQGMAHGLHQMGQQNPNMLQQVWNSPLRKGTAVGIAGVPAKELLSRRKSDGKRAVANSSMR